VKELIRWLSMPKEWMLWLHLLVPKYPSFSI